MAGKHWHRRILPRHFEPGARGRYGYRPRKRLTQIKKARIKGHTRELEWSGDMKRMVLRQSVVSGTRYRARVRIKGPRYLYQYRKDFRQPDKAGELTTVTGDENRDMARVMHRVAVRRLRQAREQRVVHM